MSSPVEQIKEKLSIVDVVSSYVKLEKAGTYQKGRCPFHNEKTPSFFVSPGRNTYHCFGCGKGGDVFSFVEEVEGVDFPAALKLLADRAGIQLKEFSAQAQGETSSLYDILEASALFFEKELRNSPSAIEYLKSRGVEGITAKDFRIGVAPDGWSVLTDYLRRKGFSEQLIEKSGMAIRGKSGLYDRFRARIMFPISSSQGKVVAFTGRVMPGAPEEAGAKYVNSPETLLYHKSSILYGYDKAKQSMLKLGVAIFVEGQMDLIMAHQAGFTQTVAVSGTAFTTEHLALVKRFANTILFSFDADSAGENALKKASQLAISLGAEAKAILLSLGKDPADVIKENKDVWAEAVSKAEPVIEYFLKKIREGTTIQERMKKVGQDILPLIAVMPQKIEQSHFIKRVAEFLEVDQEAVKSDLQKIRIDVSSLPVADAPPRQIPALDRAKMRLLGFYSAFKDKVDIAKIETVWQDIETEPIANAIEGMGKEKMNTLSMEAEMYFQGKDSYEDTVSDLLTTFELSYYEDKLTKIVNELRATEKVGDTAKAKELLGQSQTISNKIHTIKTNRHAHL
jgi:DNA primase